MLKIHQTQLLYQIRMMTFLSPHLEQYQEQEDLQQEQIVDPEAVKDQEIHLKQLPYRNLMACLFLVQVLVLVQALA